jgi:hypothetical protein
MGGIHQKFSDLARGAITWIGRRLSLAFTLTSLLASLLALTLAPACLAQQADVLRLPLEQWQVHAGNDAECAPGRLLPTNSGCAWERWSGAIRIDGWYRIEVTLPAELRGAPELGILVQGFAPVYEVYANGQKIGGSGSFATRRGPQESRALLKFPSNLAPQGKLAIAVHALGVETSRPVGDFVPAIAAYDHLQVVKDADTLNYLRHSWQHYICYAALGGAGCVFFLLFAVNTRLREYAWLGAILGQLPMLRLGELASVVDLGMPSWIGLFIYCVFNGLGAFLGIEFIFAFLGRPVPKFFRLVQLVGALDALQLLMLLPFPARQFDSLAQFLEGSAIHYALIGAILIEATSWLLLTPVCFRSRLPEMRAIGAAVLFLTFVEGNRQAHNFGLPNFPQEFTWGDLDFDLRPLAYLIFAAVMLVAMTFRLRRIQNRNREVEQEMAAAQTVQQILIPDYLPAVPGLTIESAYLPAQEVGGDFFQVLPLGRQWCERGFPSESGDSFPALIVIGDVSGKGLKAAMTVALIVGTLRTYAEFTLSPAELLAGLNRRLHGRGDSFATCLVLRIEPSGQVTLSNAGHPNPYLDGKEIATDGNLPLGITLDVSYRETSFQLAPEQTLTLLTDGVVEAKDALTREIFGFNRTLNISRQSAAQIAEAARNFGTGAPQADDITVLTVMRKTGDVGKPAGAN